MALLSLGVAGLLLLALLAPRISERLGGWAGWWLAGAPAGLFVGFLSVGQGIAGGRLVTRYEWVPSLGIEIGLALDGLSLIFALLITGIGSLVLVYAGRYLAAYPQRGRFFSILLVFMAAMLGLVLADDLITLFVFWELTGITSYLLIGFSHEKARARASALQALLVTGGGGLALLVGFLLMGSAAGTYSISEILSGGTGLTGHPTYPAILVLVLVGAFTKSAQWPFHFWLPIAMAAPTPVSAYLHSATMVKAGVYLLARLDPVLGGTDLWVWIMVPVGVLTMLLGATLALRETDLKGVLAYSTLTALGTLVTLLGLSLPEAVKAAVVFLVVHSLYKAGLFLVAGSLDFVTGTRDVRRLWGLGRHLPWTAAAALLGGLSMAGLPPLFGFVAKELTYKAKLGFGGGEILLPAVAVAANALTVAAAGILVLRPFLGRREPDAADILGARDTEAGTSAERTPSALEPRLIQPVPVAMVAAPLLLGLLGLALGLAPTLLGQGLVGSSVHSILGEPMEIRLTLWYGFNTALLLSVATVAVGALMYANHVRLRSWIQRASRALPISAERTYDLGLASVMRVASAQARLVMAGGMNTALLIILGTAAVLVWMALFGGMVVTGLPTPGVSWIAWLLAALVAVEALGPLLARSRVTGAAALGVMGFAVALLFLLSGAPDLATTQFLVETLIVLVLVLVLRSLPAGLPVPTSSRLRTLVAGAVSLALGVGFTALLLGALNEPFSQHVSEFFAVASVPEGKGRNIVNVILVDFRALDTMGEAAVLGIAALGVLILTGRGVWTRPGAKGNGGPRPAVEATSGRDVEEATQVGSPLLRTASRLLVPLLVIFSFYLLWRGHNEPGGGFVAGLVVTGALALRVQADGVWAGWRFLRLSPPAYIGLGLLLMLGSGLQAVTFGMPFMTGLWTEVPFPGESLKLGTPLLFDVGVYALVLGFGATVLLAMEEEHA